MIKEYLYSINEFKNDKELFNFTLANNGIEPEG